jgi:hypothetical protein
MKRFPWEWTLAILIGITLGLLYAWVIAPTRYIDTTPSTLRADFKDQYRMAISAAYASTGNLDRARARLQLLGDADPYQALSAQAQQMLASGQSFASIQQVAQLASALEGKNNIPPAATQTLFTPHANPLSSPSPTRTGNTNPAETLIVTEPAFPLITPTPRPTRTPTAAPGAPFIVVAQEPVCTPNLPQGLLQVNVIDSRRRPLPGIELIVTWSGGEDHFFTGFKPELGNGYADYQMQSGISYTLSIAGQASGSAPVTNITIPACPSPDGSSSDGSFSVIFQQP